MNETVVLILIIVALALAVIELIRTRAQSLLAWSVTLLAVLLAYQHLIK